MQGSIAFDGTLSGSIAGGGGGGSEVTITPTLTSGTKIADYEINSTPGELYAPTPESLTAAAPLDITSGVISIDLSGYQEKLTAGSYITIDSDNVISCSPPISVVWYTPEPDVQQDVLIGKFRVNDVIQNVYAPAGGSSWDYSTSEVDTGQKWIDGKTIYAKVIEINNFSASSPDMGIYYGSVDFNSYIPGCDIIWPLTDMSYIVLTDGTTRFCVWIDQQGKAGAAHSGAVYFSVARTGNLKLAVKYTKA